jgi:hypothetical protein
LVGHDNDELATGSIGTIGVVAATPELEAISFYPVGAYLGIPLILI